MFISSFVPIGLVSLFRLSVLVYRLLFNSLISKSLAFFLFFFRWVANSNGGVLESLGYKEGYRIDVDMPDGTWEKAPSFHDILIFNTGHW